MEIRYRQNRKEDCNWVAGLIHIAFGGVAAFSCDLIPEMTFLQSVASNLERDHSPIPIEMLFPGNPKWLCSNPRPRWPSSWFGQLTASTIHSDRRG